MADFDLLSANTVRRQMRELRRFIEFWYGPHDASFEVAELDDRLPLPLKLFYQKDGYRPFRSEPIWDTEYFYEGAGAHHIFNPKQLEFSKNGMLKFFMEYQGDFDGYTLQSEENPGVTITGYLNYEYDNKVDQIIQLPLSGFLIRAYFKTCFC